MKAFRLTAVSVACALGLAAILFVPARSFVAGAAGQNASETYKQKCAACHGPDGKGRTSMGKSMKLRDLGSADVQKMSDAQLFDTIARGKGRMPAYEKSLGHDKIHALVSHIRTFKR